MYLKIYVYYILNGGNPLKIAVCVKAVPDTETKIVLNSDKTNIETNQVKFITSPYDEFAIEEALKIKEANSGTTVTAISMGSNEAKDVLRDSLARGVDEAIHINVDKPLDFSPLTTGKILAKSLSLDSYDIILCGQQGVGTDHSQVPAILAQLLNITQATFIVKLTLKENNTFLAEREIEGSHEIVSGKLPAVFSAQKGLNEPRYPSIKGVMAARKKEIKTLDLTSLNVAEEVSKTNSLVKLKALCLPQNKTSSKNIEGDPDQQVKALVDLLRQEAKVL